MQGNSTPRLVLLGGCQHRIDFADVPEMFNQPMLIKLDQRFNYGEERWLGIGFLKQYYSYYFSKKSKSL